MPYNKEIKDPEEKKQYEALTVKYWGSAIERAGKKMPTKDWEIAEKRVSAHDNRTTEDGVVVSGDDTRPVVNDLRNHYEGSRAYLDQREPTFKTVPSPAYASDENIIKRASCERKYLEYVWQEQECQVAESQKLDSALLRNVGFTMPVFDFKKWMPAIRYLPARDVRIDPDCGGLIERASWMAYKEDISIEMLKANNPDITTSEIEFLKKKNASTLTEDEQEDKSDDEKELYQVATVWHIFAKNDSATRNYDDEEEVESLSDELKLNTVVRYLQIVEGLQRPLQDEDSWPFLLDHNENMITRLQMNKEPENLYGFTDYKQMERMDLMSDNVMSYVEADTYHAANRKYSGPNSVEGQSDINIETFLNENRKVYIPGMVGEDGKPVIQRIDVGNVNPTIVAAYELMHDQSKEASGQSELQTESVADLKDVTAIGIRWQEQKLHQRVNLRLGGPRGYEKSIHQDAVKLMEIAHQLVPKYSTVSAKRAIPDVQSGEITYEEEETLQEMKWPAAKEALRQGGTLIKLGVDAIVGEELAEFWVTTDDVPIEDIRLATQIMIVPGSTRTITQEQKAADLTEFYSNVLWPTVYEPMGRFDLAKKYLEHVGQLKGVDRMEDYLPKDDEIDQFLEEQKQAQQAQQQAEQQQGQQQMQIAEQQAQMDQAASEQEIQKDALKNDMEIEKEVVKGQLEQEKGRMQISIMEKQAQQKSPERK